MGTNKQIRAFYNSVRAVGERDELFFEMVRAGDMTKRDLRALLARSPERYGRYAGYVEQLPE
ncbi:hypothetical protein [Brevundimonas sp.]|jgi:hypothetical protein|uniref:hypothetical protein n=1 Tax=Brevundimonas sp. TaxID=1871086 RepID=UPI003784596E